MSYTSIADPANDINVKPLRRDLREGIVKEFQRLRGAYP
jgi:hypothetical protein